MPLWELDQKWIENILETEMRDVRVEAIFVYEYDRLYANKERNSSEKSINTAIKHTDNDFIKRTKAIIQDGSKIGDVEIYLSKTAMNKQLNEELYGALRLAILESILISFVLGVILNNLIIRPLNTLSDSTERISKGDYAHSINLKSNDEIGLLAASFNTMKDEIQKRESELIESMQELDRFFTVSLDMLCITDMEGNFLRLNASWEQVLGYPIEEIYEHKFFDFIHPDDIPATLGIVEQLSSQQSSITGFKKIDTGVKTEIIDGWSGNLFRSETGYMPPHMILPIRSSNKKR